MSCWQPSAEALLLGMGCLGGGQLSTDMFYQTQRHSDGMPGFAELVPEALDGRLCTVASLP